MPGGEHGGFHWFLLKPCEFSHFTAEQTESQRSFFFLFGFQKQLAGHRPSSCESIHAFEEREESGGGASGEEGNILVFRLLLLGPWEPRGTALGTPGAGAAREPGGEATVWMGRIIIIVPARLAQSPASQELRSRVPSFPSEGPAASCPPGLHPGWAAVPELAGPSSPLGFVHDFLTPRAVGGRNEDQNSNSISGPTCCVPRNAGSFF